MSQKFIKMLFLITLQQGGVTICLLNKLYLFMNLRKFKKLNNNLIHHIHHPFLSQKT